MAFRDVLGQKKVIEWLKTAIKQKRLASAYIFIGLQGVGKMKVALDLAKALNCLFPKDEDGCERCESCKKINARVHPDILVIKPQGETTRIEQIRELQQTLSLKPLSVQRRVIIIDKAETMSLEAANAFLKILEEPPLNTILILVTQDKYQLLPTIISRCQMVLFRPLPLKIIKETLEVKGVSPSKALFLAHLAEGSLGKALDFLEKERILSLFTPRFKKDNSIYDMLNLIEFLTASLKNSKDMLKLLDVYQGVWRDILFIKNNCESFLINKTELKEYKRIASNFSQKHIRNMLILTEEAKKLTKQNVQKRLIWEHLFLKEKMTNETYWN